MRDDVFFSLTRETVDKYWGKNFEPEKLIKLGFVKGWKKKKNKVDISCENSLLRITVLSSSIIKVHLAPEGKVLEGHSVAVADEGASFSDFTLNDEGDHIEIRTSELVVRINKNPALVSFYDRKGEVISSEIGPMRWKKAKEGYATVCTMAMPSPRPGPPSTWA